MKVRYVLVFSLVLLCLSACVPEDVRPAPEIQQVQADSTEEEEESTTSGEDS